MWILTPFATKVSDRLRRVSPTVLLLQADGKVLVNWKSRGDQPAPTTYQRGPAGSQDAKFSLVVPFSPSLEWAGESCRRKDCLTSKQTAKFD